MLQKTVLIVSILSSEHSGSEGIMKLQRKSVVAELTFLTHVVYHLTGSKVADCSSD